MRSVGTTGLDLRTVIASASIAVFWQPSNGVFPRSLMILIGKIHLFCVCLVRDQ